jgi:catechol 2,3-dioxygenase
MMAPPTTQSGPGTVPAGAPAYGLVPPGYRLPDATRLGRVRLQVADLARSLAYYRRVIGLRVLAQTGDGATLGARGGGPLLLELRKRQGARPVPPRGGLGLYHFAILLPDRAALGRFVQHLAAIGEYAGMSDHLVSEGPYLTDPDGLGIEVYADRPRSAWGHEGRQLHMTIAPLDVQDLVRAAAGEPWAGMPPGTVIGHVHLNVSDVEAAGAFYHTGLGFDKTVWSYPGALFLSARGYHHLGTNTWAAGAPLADDDDARLLDWEILLPDEASVAGAAASLERAGHDAERSAGAVVVRDPWRITVRIARAGAGR